jgi:hypothetical protein
MDKRLALQLAGYWAAKNDQGEYLYSSLRFREETAAELRRLVAENERLHQINQSHEMKLSVRGYEIQIEDLRLAHAELRKRNAELLEAMISFTNSAYIKKQHPKRYAAAMAAIAKAEVK